MYNMHEAKTHFSKLVETVIQGHEVVIAKAGKPVVKIEPFVSKKPRRRFGILKGKITIADDFDAQLPDEFLKDFEN